MLQSEIEKWIKFWKKEKKKLIKWRPAHDQLANCIEAFILNLKEFHLKASEEKKPKIEKLDKEKLLYRCDKFEYKDGDIVRKINEIIDRLNNS